MFTAGFITAQQALALNELWRQYVQWGFRVTPVSWPLTVHRAGRLAGQIIGIDPRAINKAEDDGTGSGGDTHEYIGDICLDGTGGGYLRIVVVDFAGRVVDEYCRAIGVCGSGENGNLCDDLLPESGSGSGSGGGPMVFAGCDYEYPETIYGTFSGWSGGCLGLNGSVPLAWDGVKWSGTYAAPGGDITITLTPAAFSGGNSFWTKGYSSSAYTFTGLTGSVFIGCGNLPAPGVVTVTGACTGGGTFGFSE